MTTVTKKPQGKRLTDTNVYRLSNKAPINKSIFLSKLILKKHGSIQIESVGTATSDSTRVAQTLVKHGYAKIRSIKTDQFVPERENARFQIKLTIVLDKTAEFDKLTESIVLRSE